MTMGWIRRTEPTPVHTCEPPMREQRWRIPKSWLSPDATETYHSEQVPDGKDRDLWRCGACNQVWTIRWTCFVCQAPIDRSDRYGCARRGHVASGLVWSRAGWWAQRRYRNRAAYPASGDQLGEPGAEFAARIKRNAKVIAEAIEIKPPAGKQ